MTRAQSVAAATGAIAIAAIAAVAGGTAGVAAAVVASRWFPIGRAAGIEPSPGTSVDWVVLGPGLVLALLLVTAPIVQWPRLDAGRSDDLGTSGTGPAPGPDHCH
jgi:hypothetical protein